MPTEGRRGSRRDRMFFGVALVATACANGAAGGGTTEPPVSPASSASADASASVSPSTSATSTAGSEAAPPDAGPPAAPSNTGAPMLECQIAVAPRLTLGKPVTVHFRLTQRSPQTVYVLNWRTPLEGLRGDDFQVVRDGVDIPYQGPVFKRGDPSAKSYLAMDPGKPLEADVDLALAYDFGKPGRYRITFRGHIWDLVTQKGDLPRPLARHQAIPLQCAPVETEIAKP